MSNDLNNKQNEKIKADENLTLDDEQRIKILSPGMLVFKRFIRNKLAITGAIFIIVMFLFSFVGGWVSPYGEKEVFKKTENMLKDYGGISMNEDMKFISAEGTEFPLIAQPQFIQAANKGEEIFESQDVSYSQKQLAENLHMIYGVQTVASAAAIGKAYEITVTDDSLGDGFADAFSLAIANGETFFGFEGSEFVVSADRKSFTAGVSKPVAIALMNIYDYTTSGVA